MSSSSPILPSGWAEILEEIQSRLEPALAAANARVEQLEAIDVVQTTQARQQEAARLEVCLQGLSERLASAERLVNEVDLSLQTSELILQQQSALCGNVRQKLAAWAGRAIG